MRPSCRPRDRDIADELTPDQVLALGREVGIPGRYLQQALLEERTRTGRGQPAGTWERIAGPGQVVAQRVVPGTVADVEAALMEWLEEKELFCVQRRQPGRITWEPLGGLAAAPSPVDRGAQPRQRGDDARRADTVAATILALEPGALARDAARRGAARRGRSSSGGGAAVAGRGHAGRRR